MAKDQLVHLHSSLGLCSQDPRAQIAVVLLQLELYNIKLLNILVLKPTVRCLYPRFVISALLLV